MWLNDNSYLAIRPVAELFQVDVEDLAAKSIVVDWWIQAFSPIPEANAVLIVGAPKTEDGFSYSPRFARVNIETSTAEELSIRPANEIRRETLVVAPNARFAAYIEVANSRCFIASLESGEINLIAENVIDFDWSTDGRYLVITANDRFTQYDLETGESIDLGETDGAVVLKVEY